MEEEDSSKPPSSSITSQISILKEKYLNLQKEEKEAKKFFSYKIFFESLPTLLIYLTAVLFCAHTLEKMCNDQRLKIYPIVIIVDSILIFMGNLEIAFDMNILNATTLIFLREQSEIKGERKSSYKIFFRHIKKSSIFLFINAFLVSLIAIFITSAYKMIYFYKEIGMKFIITISLCIIPTCIISTIITIVSVVSVILICHKFNLDPENIAMPLAASINEVLTLLVLREFFLGSLKWKNSELIFLSSFYLIMLIGLFISIYRERKNINNSSDIAISSPHISTYICTFIGLALSAGTIEKMSEKYPKIAPISLIYCSIVANIIMIYSSRICHRVTEIFERGKTFYNILFSLTGQYFKKKPYFENFKALVEKSTKLEKMCFKTLIFSSFLVISIYFSVFYFYMKEFQDLIFMFILFIFFMLSCIIAMISIPYFIILDHWVEKGLDFIDEDLLNGKIGSNCLIFGMMTVDVLGCIYLSLIFKLYYK